jgi:membrane protein YdbS with pleckstrin-like domain
MLCPSCNAPLADDAVFCSKCGAKIGGAPPAMAAKGAGTPVERMRAAQASAAGAAGSEAERELWRGSFSPKAMYGSWLLAGIATIVAAALSVIVPNPITWLAAGVIVAVIWIVLAVNYLIERWSVAYVLTTQRFVHQRGLFNRVINRIEVIDIDDVTVEQGFIERMFGVGTIRLLSSDTSDPKLNLRGIDDAKRIATLIDDARREERRKRGLYMEAV